jgi:hypothetical protein
MMDDRSGTLWSKDAHGFVRAVPVRPEEAVETCDMVEVEVGKEEHFDHLDFCPRHPIQAAFTAVKQQPMLRLSGVDRSKHGVVSPRLSQDFVFDAHRLVLDCGRGIGTIVFATVPVVEAV